MFFVKWDLLEEREESIFQRFYFYLKACIETLIGPEKWKKFRASNVGQALGGGERRSEGSCGITGKQQPLYSDMPGNLVTQLTIISATSWDFIFRPIKSIPQTVQPSFTVHSALRLQLLVAVCIATVKQNKTKEPSQKTPSLPITFSFFSIEGCTRQLEQKYST